MAGRLLVVDYTDPDVDTRPALLLGVRHASELIAITGDWLTLRTPPSRIAAALDTADTLGDVASTYATHGVTVTGYVSTYGEPLVAITCDPGTNDGKPTINAPSPGDRSAETTTYPQSPPPALFRFLADLLEQHDTLNQRYNTNAGQPELETAVCLDGKLIGRARGEAGGGAHTLEDAA